MNFGLRNSIGVRLLRTVFGCYLIVTVIVTVTELYFEYSNVEKGVVTELYNVGRSFEDGLSAALWTLDIEAIDSILAGVQKIEVVEGVRVTNLQGDVNSSRGVFRKDLSDKNVVGKINLNNILASEVAMEANGKTGTYYEYRLDIMYSEFENINSELVGHVYIYAGRDTVISRFKVSLFLTLINAVIKTAALWVIFLYFSRRFLSQPLSDLTRATSVLSDGDMQSHSLHNRLREMATSLNKNELQQLASSFLVMRESILEKIHNLNVLNQLAVILTQANDQQKIYERLYSRLSNTFGAHGAIVLGKDGSVIWQSQNLESESINEKLSFSNIKNYDLDIVRGRNAIEFRRFAEGSLEGGRPQESVPLLYLPLWFGADEKNEMWLMGDIKKNRLGEGGRLNEESHSFLQVATNIAGATLTSIKQRQVIENQNRTLELRVQERTRELADANEELRHMAVHDPLTHLPNRTLFNDRLDHLIDVASRENKHFAVASIDLGKFKQINDTYGHDVGDAVLVEVGRRFSSVLSKSDTLARMGGDEFAAILVRDNIENSIDVVVSKLLNSLKAAISLQNGENLFADADIGVSIFPNHGTNADMLFKCADIAMYQAKRTGQGYAVFDKEKNSKEKEYMQFMYELDNAIERGQLRLHYQPIVDLRNNKVVFFEALVRWEHPERGLVLPDMFIVHAEKTSLIKSITLWVIDEACKQCSQWHKKGIELSVSVNLSPRILTLPDLPDKLQAIVGKYSLEPKWLKLEITESAAMSDPKKTLAIISSLSEKGFTLAIDDFGTGYSSLSYLTLLPFNELKIDKSFLINMDASSQVVVSTIIELAHKLKLYVIAEGVEDEETQNFLIEKGCDAVQGYYICHPSEASVVEEWFFRDSGIVADKTYKK